LTKFGQIISAFVPFRAVLGLFTIAGSFGGVNFCSSAWSL